MKKRAKILASFISLFLLLIGCSNETTKESKEVNAAGKITVQGTIFPIVDFTEKIGGEYVEVTSVYPPGADSHTYEPTQKQMVEIAKADIFIYSGAGLEGFADKVESVLKDEDTTIVVASQDISFVDDEEEEHDHEHDEDDGHHHGDVDPHIWFDSIRAITMAENIKNALVAQMPSQQAYFESNFEQLKASLEQLDKDYQEIIAESELKTILVSHAAYGYWTERYGLQQIAVAGLTSTDEPSQKELAAIVQEAKKQDITTILFETLSTPKVAKVVKEEANLEMMRLNHVATITDEDKEANKDYIALMKENLAVLKEVLNP